MTRSLSPGSPLRLQYSESIIYSTEIKLSTTLLLLRIYQQTLQIEEQNNHPGSYCQGVTYRSLEDTVDTKEIMKREYRWWRNCHINSDTLTNPDALVLEYVHTAWKYHQLNLALNELAYFPWVGFVRAPTRPGGRALLTLRPGKYYKYYRSGKRSSDHARVPERADSIV